MRRLPPALIILLITFNIGLPASESAAREPAEIVLVLDNSGSMKSNDPQFLVRDVALNFINGLNADDAAAVVTFGAVSRVLTPLTVMKDKALKRRAGGSLNRLDYSERFTDIPGGIERGMYELENRGRENTVKTIILLTDGIIDTGDKKKDDERKDWLLDSLIRECRKKKFRIVSIAFTEKSDFLLLRELARITEGKYFRILKPNEIKGVFEKAAEFIHTRPAVAKSRPTRFTGAETAVEYAEYAEQPEYEKYGKYGKYLPIIIGSILLLLLIVLAWALVRLLREKKLAPLPQIPAADVQRREPGEVNMPFAKLIDMTQITGKRDQPLRKEIVKIGKLEGNDIMIPEDHVSRKHAEIHYIDGAFFIKDLASSNHTRLNGKIIAADKPHKLKNGDRIRFDKLEFAFVLEAFNAEATMLYTNGMTQMRTVSSDFQSEIKEMEKQDKDATVDFGADLNELDKHEEEEKEEEAPSDKQSVQPVRVRPKTERRARPRPAKPDGDADFVAREKTGKEQPEPKPVIDDEPTADKEFVFTKNSDFELGFNFDASFKADKPVKPKKTAAKTAPDLDLLFCPVHPSRLATMECDLCGKGFCRECISIIDGQKICVRCRE